MTNVEVTPAALTRLLEEQQKAAVMKWVADPFGNHVKTFPVQLPEGSSINHQGVLKEWTDKPFDVLLNIHEVRVSKQGSTRAARLPDGGSVHANGTWTWGPGNEQPTP